MANIEEVLNIVSKKIRNILCLANLEFEYIQEIRIRIQEPFMIRYKGRDYFINEIGQLTVDNSDVYIVTCYDIKETISYISSYSLYAYEEEIRQGYITVMGGHRVGIAGKTIIENRDVKTIKNISFINIRVAHEKKGCGEAVLPYIYDRDRVCHTLIISPPGCGKTTLLRDLIRLISTGYKSYVGVAVGVVDERSEIGACYQGIPQNDIGIQTDLLDCCPKAEGMLMLIRSMSPKVIAVDEIGKMEDVEALAYVINCGCKMIATVHGESVEDIRNKPVFRKLVEEGYFKRYIVLSGTECPGKVGEIYDDHGTVLYDWNFGNRM